MKKLILALIILTGCDYTTTLTIEDINQITTLENVVSIDIDNYGLIDREWQVRVFIENDVGEIKLVSENKGTQGPGTHY